MNTILLKWWQTMKTAWSQYTAYRLNFFLQIIGPALVFFFVKYNLWSAIYAGDNEVLIGGYQFEQMIKYHIWALVVGLIAQGHSALNLAEDIRLGKISTYLIYPFNFWEFHTAHFLAFQLLQVIISVVTIIAIIALGLLTPPTLSILIQGYIYCLFVSLFWFSLQYMTGLFGFWLEETWILRVILQILTGFLSGAIIPLEFYPEKFVQFLDYTPFPYLTFYPIKIFMGDYSSPLNAYLIVSGWIVLFCVINHFIWRRGIRLYTAAGM